MSYLGTATDPASERTDSIFDPDAREEALPQITPSRYEIAKGRDALTEEGGPIPTDREVAQIIGEGADFEPHELDTRLF